MLSNWIAFKWNTIGLVISARAAAFGSRPQTQVILLIEGTYFHRSREESDGTAPMSDHALSVEPREGAEFRGGSVWIIKISVDIDLIFSYCQGEI